MLIRSSIKVQPVVHLPRVKPQIVRLCEIKKMIRRGTTRAEVWMSESTTSIRHARPRQHLSALPAPGSAPGSARACGARAARSARTRPLRAPHVPARVLLAAPGPHARVRPAPKWSSRARPTRTRARRAARPLRWVYAKTAIQTGPAVPHTDNIIQLMSSSRRGESESYGERGRLTIRERAHASPKRKARELRRASTACSISRSSPSTCEWRNAGVTDFCGWGKRSAQTPPRTRPVFRQSVLKSVSSVLTCSQLVCRRPQRSRARRAGRARHQSTGCRRGDERDQSLRKASGTLCKQHTRLLRETR